VIRSQSLEEPAISLYGPPPVPPPGPDGAFPTPPPPPPPPPGAGLDRSLNAGVAVDQPLNPGAWGKTTEFWDKLTHPNTGCSHGLFQSDEAFNCYFIEPVSNPFLDLDPRALTELRPIYIFSSIPSNNPTLGGGNAQFYGLQGRLAFCESLSLVIDKLGFVSLEPHSPTPPFAKASGFSEFWLGPQWTFFRAPGNGTAIATGLIFQLPVGSNKVFQDTGTLTLDPYLSFAQNFRLASYGSLNLMSTTGFAVATDNKRSDYFHSSFHIDYDVINAHKFYPLLELNWLQYTRAGKETVADFEGGDLFNFGSTLVNGKGLITMAGGMRYKFCDSVQVGAAAEFPLTSYKGLEDFRFTVDLILRY